MVKELEQTTLFSGTMYIKKEELTNILQERFEDFTNHDAESLATYLLNLFGFHKAIPDNMLRDTDREVFYMLVDKGVIKRWYINGTFCLYGRKKRVWRNWNIHYWELVTPQNHRQEQIPETEKDIYASLPNDAWQRNI